VEEFEVSSPGLGTLRWPGTTDVRSVLPRLAEIVAFRPLGVTLYPSAADQGLDEGSAAAAAVLPKPPPGEGLNKRCVYTMEGVWAKDRQTGEYLLDAKSVGAFRQQLLRKADLMQASMVGYDHRKGEWTVEVPHF
jgi:hypothetical protein